MRSILICEFLAPYNLPSRNVDFIYSPPQRVHLFHEGSFVGPFVYGREMHLDMDTLKREYRDNIDDVQPIRFFCHGDPYQFWGLFEADIHLVCPAVNGQIFLLGTDRLGRDVLSRIIYGARISLTIGLFGITVSFVLGIIIGGIAGYEGGVRSNLPGPERVRSRRPLRGARVHRSRMCTSRPGRWRSTKCGSRTRAPSKRRSHASATPSTSRAPGFEAAAGAAATGLQRSIRQGTTSMRSRPTGPWR